MATDLDYDRLRQDIGADSESLSDNDAAAIFVEAGEEYSTTVTIKAATRVIALTRLRAQAAKLNDYTQDTTTEKMSQVFDHLGNLLEEWQGKLSDAIKSDAKARSGGAARFGGKRTIPSRVQEWPGERVEL